MHRAYIADRLYCDSYCAIILGEVVQELLGPSRLSNASTTNYCREGWEGDNIAQINTALCRLLTNTYRTTKNKRKKRLLYLRHVCSPPPLHGEYIIHATGYRGTP